MHLQVLGYVAVLFVGAASLAGLVFVATVPRLLQPGCARTPSTRSTGSATGCYRVVARTTNSRFLCILFGDSSAILHYLRLVGYRFGRPLVQSGSNFGVEVRHENPYLSGVGSGTMVSDGLSFMNAEFSSTSFRLRRADAGRAQLPRQRHRLPAGARTGRQLPARDEGHGADRREGPRATSGCSGRLRSRSRGRSKRDRAFDDLKAGDEQRRRLRAKNRHNTATAAMFLLAQLVNLDVVAVIGTVALDLYREHGFWVVAARPRSPGSAFSIGVPDPAGTGGHVVPAR